MRPKAPPLPGLLLLLALAAPAVPTAAEASAPAETPSYFDTFTFHWENDAFTGTDRDYTNGLKLTWSTPFDEPDQSSLPAWSFPVFDRLPLTSAPGAMRAVSLSFGQDIYTPDDSRQTTVIKDDRPYAGWTYLAAGFHQRDGRSKDSWELLLGIVGPASQAEKTQILVHDLLGIDRARGWDNQLHNEPTLDVSYEKQRRLWAHAGRSGIGFDLISHLGGRLGSAKTYLNGGGELRLGWHLPNDFGSCPIRAGCETDSAFNLGKSPPAGFHFFIAADAKAVAHDIFLDGNTFRDSHSVDKKILVGELMGGFAWQLGPTEITYSYIYRSKEFYTQDQNHRFGSLSIAWRY